MSAKQETLFKNQVARDLTALERMNKIWFKKIQQVAIRGVPDYLICANGFFVAIELKREYSIPADALQTYNLRQIEKCHGLALVASPENWDECYAVICSLCDKDNTKKFQTKKHKATLADDQPL